MGLRFVGLLKEHATSLSSGKRDRGDLTRGCLPMSRRLFYESRCVSLTGARCFKVAEIAVARSVTPGGSRDARCRR